MTLDQLIEQVRVERTKAAVQLSTLDAALAALTKATAITVPAPAGRKGRVWTPEQRAPLLEVFLLKSTMGTSIQR